MNPPPLPATCPQCRAPLPPGAPLGLCPACLLDAAGTESESGVPVDPFAAPLDLVTLRRAFPQLEILAPLGAGGMGRVYKVRQPNLDRVVALKILPPELARDAAWVERFTREARALARLNHPHIVQVYDVGQTMAADGIPAMCWLVMEYVDGVNLRQVQRTGGLSAREALAIIPRLCDALQYAHEKGVLHRDIKPENILLDAAGNVKIADFGLAKLGGPNAMPTLTLTGARLGTAAYMAPEQIESPQDVDHRADIYSLGVVLYEMLTGGLPLGRFPAPSEKSGTDPRLDQIVFRTLEKERDRRYQAAGEIRTALETVAALPAPAPAAPLPPGPGAIPPRPREVKAPPPAGDLPPPLPAGAVRKSVSYRDLGVPFPRSAAEDWGHGCGVLMVFPFQLALAMVPAVIPVACYGGAGEWQWGRDLWAKHPETWLPVAVLTGIVAVFAARPLLTSLRLPLLSGVKSKVPWLMLMAALLWGTTAVLTSGLMRSWPNDGAAGRLMFSTKRPPLSSGTAASSDQELERLLQAAVQVSHSDGMASLIASGDPRTLTESGTNPYSNFNYSRQESSALTKAWEVVAVGSDAQSISHWLLKTGEVMRSALPESVRETVTISLEGHSASYRDWPVRISQDYGMAFMGIFMTLGGWLVALCRSKPWVTAAGPWLLLAGGAALWVHPAVWLPGLVPVPAAVMTAEDPRLNAGVTYLETRAAAAPDGPEAALLQYIDACRRIDRARASALSAKELTDLDWEQAVAFWRGRFLLYVGVLPEENGTHSFYCHAFRLYDAQDSMVDGRKSGSLEIIKVQKPHDTWLVIP